MFLIGSFGQCVSMVIAFACLIPGTPAAANGAVFGLFAFLFFFGATWLELPWLYPAEVNPLRTRTNANAVSTTSNWLFNVSRSFNAHLWCIIPPSSPQLTYYMVSPSQFAVVQFTPPFLAATAWGCFLFFAVMNALFIPVIYFFYIETAGRTLEEIDLIFATGFAEKRTYVSVSIKL